jgi:hypothetical protein
MALRRSQAYVGVRAVRSCPDGSCSLVAGLVRDEPVSRARASALARTTSGSRGSAGRSSGQGRPRRILGLTVRMRFMSSPVAGSAGRWRAAPAVLGHCLAQAPAVQRTRRRLPHEPSTFAPPRSPGDHRTPGPPAQHTLGCRGHARPRRWLSGPDLGWVYRSVAAPTRTGPRPRSRWCWHGTSLAAFSAPYWFAPALMTLRNAAASDVRLMDELSTGPYAPWRTPGGAAVGGDKRACPLAMHSQFGRSAYIRLDSRCRRQPLASGSAAGGGGISYRRVHRASMITSWAMPVSMV